jgi:hypothetical protein
LLSFAWIAMSRIIPGWIRHSGSSRWVLVVVEHRNQEVAQCAVRGQASMPPRDVLILSPVNLLTFPFCSLTTLRHQPRTLAAVQVTKSLPWQPWLCSIPRLYTSLQGSSTSLTGGLNAPLPAIAIALWLNEEARYMRCRHLRVKLCTAG